MRVSLTSPGWRLPQGFGVSVPDFCKGVPAIPRRRHEVCVCADRPAEHFFFSTGRGPFSFRQDRKENGGRICSAIPMAVFSIQTDGTIPGGPTPAELFRKEDVDHDQTGRTGPGRAAARHHHTRLCEIRGGQLPDPVRRHHGPLLRQRGGQGAAPRAGGRRLGDGGVLHAAPGQPGAEPPGHLQIEALSPQRGDPAAGGPVPPGCRGYDEAGPPHHHRGLRRAPGRRRHPHRLRHRRVRSSGAGLPEAGSRGRPERGPHPALRHRRVRRHRGGRPPCWTCSTARTAAPRWT